MALNISATKVVLIQQIHIVVIRVICLFVILFAVKSNATSQNKDVSFYLKKEVTSVQVVKLLEVTVTT